MDDEPVLDDTKGDYMSRTLYVIEVLTEGKPGILVIPFTSALSRDEVLSEFPPAEGETLHPSRMLGRTYTNRERDLETWYGFHGRRFGGEED